MNKTFCELIDLGIAEMNEKIANQQKILNDLKEAFNQKIKELNRIAPEYAKLKIEESYKELKKKKKEEINKPDMHLKLKANLITELIDGIPVEWKARTKSEWQQIFTKETTLIGFLGDHKTGKTYLLSQLIGKSFNYHPTKRTEGLALVFGDNQYQKHVYYLDSAGSSEPTQFYRKKYKEELKNNAGNKQVKRDRNQQQLEQEENFEQQMARQQKYKETMIQNITLDKFFQNFIMEHSSLVIVMVQRLTLGQQFLVNYIQQLSNKEKNLRKNIIVVHNFYDIFFQDQLDVLIEKDIKNCFKITEMRGTVDYQQQDGTLKTSEQTIWLDRSQQNKILHLVMANDKSEPAILKKYNHFTIEYIKKEISINYNNFLKNQNLFEIVQKYFNDHYEQYVNVEYAEEDKQYFRQNSEYNTPEKISNFEQKHGFEPFYQTSVDAYFPSYYEKEYINQQTGETEIINLKTKETKKKTEQCGWVLKSDRLKRAKSTKIVELDSLIQGLFITPHFKDVFEPEYNIYKIRGKIIIIFDIPGLDVNNFGSQIKLKLSKNKDKERRNLILLGHRMINSQKQDIYQKLEISNFDDMFDIQKDSKNFKYYLDNEARGFFQVELTIINF